MIALGSRDSSAGPGRTRGRDRLRRPGWPPAGGTVLLLSIGLALLPGCAPAAAGVPRCEGVRRLALVAQALPEAAYVPCLDHLEEGWSDQRFVARKGRVTFRLEPERAGGRPVEVVFDDECDDVEGVPTTPRAEGVRTSIDLVSISPRYTGTLVDVFPGGCVTYRFDFGRGPHIPLMEELQETVGLMSRRQLSLDLRRELSVELDP